MTFVHGFIPQAHRFREHSVYYTILRLLGENDFLSFNLQEGTGTPRSQGSPCVVQGLLIVKGEVGERIPWSLFFDILLCFLIG